MSDAPAPDAPGPVVPDAPGEAPGAAPAEEDGKDWQAEAAKWKALSRRHEAAAKDNAAAAKRLAELEDAAKSDTQRLADQVAAATAERDAARAEAAALRLAARYRLEEADLDLLGTGSPEQLEARAKRLAALKHPAEKPAGDLGQGRRPGAPAASVAAGAARYTASKTPRTPR